MPDFDIDFCMNRRDEVIKYVTDKYGKDNVGQIVDDAPAQGARRASATSRARWASRSPRPTRSPSSCPSRCRARRPPIARRSSRSRGSRSSTTRARCTASCSTSRQALEGLNRHAGMHAAGVVIGERPLWEYVPVLPPAGDDDGIVTQFDKDEVEKAGPGQVRLPRPQDADRHPDLRSSSSTASAPRAARRRFDIDADPARRRRGLQDDLRGRTSPACSSSSRPASASCSRSSSPTASRTSSPRSRSTGRARSRAAWSTTSSSASTGASRSSTTHPSLEPILKDTYGVIVYQEQVMQIAPALAGYSLGQAPICCAARWARRRPR